ncbi:phage head-binding domain-containing protein [Xenorhabdus szentirmaii]|uniref:phage head-binding domain-containing protein n=1 Tax=Xenorhabdus szentirmaii TaxID=290112 RepID=UPI0019BC1F07|nr:phage head-binding domain-containing protein [Xenorhabdus sp. 5]MBD2825616.1 hypothetical protein [Xenorhabdus sp. 5]
MSEIIPNVVVSMPSQLFTMARSFKACSNGRIYIGKIDTDPTLPENQIQIYLEREDGTHIPMPQPIIINSAGYPVYAGQIAKFVTVEGHSMAVYDSYGAQQFYFPNVLKYDPDRLKQKLISEDIDKGDALIAVKQPIIGAVKRTAHDWFADIITVKDMGLTGNGVTDESPLLLSALKTLSENNLGVIFPPGIYLCHSDITFDIPSYFMKGAILKPRNGAQLTFDSEINTARFQIFDTDDDFYVNPIAKPSIKIAKGGVCPEWFGAKTVSSYDEIGNAIDSSGSFMKSWRATTGEYTEKVTESYRQSEYMHSYISLGAGKYRMNRETFLGHTELTPTKVRYNKNGGGVIGEGSGISVLIYTDPDYDGNAFFTAADMSGEMHIFRDFKCAFYNPNAIGNDKFKSSVGAMMLFTTIDSITTTNLWAAGASLLVSDPSGFGRGGVGIQFESLVDHSFNNLLVEHCIHGIAFSSCISTGNNAKGFSNTLSDIAFGNMIPAWPDIIIQTTANRVCINGMESKANDNTVIVFGTNDNIVDISGVAIDGRAESASYPVTKTCISFATGGGVSGIITGFARHILYGVINDGGTAMAGRDGSPLVLDFTVNDVSGDKSSENAVVIADKIDSNILLTLGVSKSNFPVIRNNSSLMVARINVSGINLSSGSPSGVACVISTGGNLIIDHLKISDSSITDIAYVKNSTLVLPPIRITPVSTISKGNGGVVKTGSLIDY